MPYELVYSNDAAKELKKLDKSIAIQILKKIEELQENPEIGALLLKSVLLLKSNFCY